MAKQRLLCAWSAAMSAAMLAVSTPALAQAPAATPGHVSWYGDPKAPDISGVWVRVDEPAAGGRSREGWTPFPPPLKGKFAEIWKKRVADAAAGTRTDDPIRACLPPGMPRFMTGMTTPMLILQTPGRVMIYRDGLPVRRIWLDGRPQPDARDMEMFFSGNAMGRYEGQDLVTDVRGLRDQPIDSTGIPHSDDLQIAEHFHRVDAKTLRVEVTLTDKTAYTRPIKTVVTYRQLDDPLWEPHELLCTPEKAYHAENYVK